MELIPVTTNTCQYPVYIGDGILGNSVFWAKLLLDRPVLVVSNEVVAPLYLNQLLAALPENQVEYLILADGEHTKNLETWQLINAKLAELKYSRDSCIIALGGGVVGDIAGFAAACWMRGIDIIQVPTSLLAQVDASVGGKTAINHPAGKNLIGAFHQPVAVVIDCLTLNTLPTREFNAGLAEIIKYGAISDADFFAWIEQHSSALTARLPETVEQAVITSVHAKARQVSADELEQGSRALLNFGHTFAHALETTTDYQRWLHGEAVSIGMILAARLSTRLGMENGQAEQRLLKLATKLGLAVPDAKLPENQLLINSMRLDKKNLGGNYRFILLRKLGEAFICADVADEDLRAVLDSFRNPLSPG